LHCEPPPGFADGDILEDGVKGDDEGDSSLSAVAAAHGVSAALGGAARPSLTTMWDDAIPSSTHASQEFTPSDQFGLFGLSDADLLLAHDEAVAGHLGGANSSKTHAATGGP